MTCDRCQRPYCVGYACAHRAPDAVGIEAQRYLDEQLNRSKATDEWECAECGWTGEAREIGRTNTCPKCGEGWCLWPETPRFKTRL